jgi:hypothetical protein
MRENLCVFDWCLGTHFIRFAGTKVQILTQICIYLGEEDMSSPSPLYSLYWYKSTNTDAYIYTYVYLDDEDMSVLDALPALIVLLVQKYKY